jgi:hypothetical protein
MNINQWTKGNLRLENIKYLYQSILDREADHAGLNHWNQSNLSIHQIENFLKESNEAKRIVENSRHRISKYASTVCVDKIKPLSLVVEEAFNVFPDQWDGSLHIHMPGKTGEILFLLGSLPTLRTMVPKAKIIVHTLPHYIDVVTNVLNGPDEVKALEYLRPTLAESTADAVIFSPFIGFEITGSDLSVNAYRTNPGFTKDLAMSLGPFYRAFADAIGAIPFCFNKPTWIPLTKPQHQGPIALALATTNPHSSIRQKLPFSPNQWRHLASKLKERGLTPVATGHHEDPAPNPMPGWEWINCNLVDAVTMILNAEYVIGGNSGLAFAAASIGKAQTIIVDERNWKMTSLCYGLEPLKNAIDIDRLWAILTPADGSRDEQAYELALRIASEPSLRGGFTIGYKLICAF